MKTQRGILPGLLVILCLSIAGCAGIHEFDSSQLSALQVRAIETRVYDNRGTKAMLKTALNVLQDDGFLVDYGNPELGILHASRTMNGETGSQTSVSGSSLTVSSSYSTTTCVTANLTTIGATVNVSDFGEQTKVRINFQRIGSRPNWGLMGAVASVTATPIKSPKVYQEFFAKLERALFIEKQGL